MKRIALLLLAMMVLMFSCIIGETDESWTIITYSAENITSNSATCRGNIESADDQSITTRGVCWNHTGDPTVSDSHTTDGSGTGEFESQLTGLTADTVYYVRAYASNSTRTSYGNQVSFRTFPGFYVGQLYGGGVILILDYTGQHGLIAAETDQSTGAPWGCMGNEIGGGFSMNYGQGQANTNLIVGGCGEAGIAARICDELVLDEYDDWFLPSYKELEMMCQAQGLPGCNIFSPAFYWSSTQFFKDNAYGMDFITCTGDFPNKEYPRYVRAVRYF